MIIYEIESLSSAPINGPYDGLKIATGTVISPSVDHASLLGKQVQVVDHSGMLDQTDIGTTSQAFWAVAQSLAPGAKPNELTPSHWYALPRGHRRRVNESA